MLVAAAIMLGLAACGGSTAKSTSARADTKSTVTTTTNGSQVCASGVISGSGPTAITTPPVCHPADPNYKAYTPPASTNYGQVQGPNGCEKVEPTDPQHVVGPPAGWVTITAAQLAATGWKTVPC